jgi:hypothetical protein
VEVTQEIIYALSAPSVSAAAPGLVPGLHSGSIARSTSGLHLGRSGVGVEVGEGSTAYQSVGENGFIRPIYNGNPEAAQRQSLSTAPVGYTSSYQSLTPSAVQSKSFSNPPPAVSADCTEGYGLLSLIPPVPDSFPELQRMNILQLQRLLNDSVALKAHAHTVITDHTAPTRRLLEDMLRSYGKEAEALLQIEEELAVRRAEVQSLQYSLREELLHYNKSIESCGRKYGTDTSAVIEELRKSIESVDRRTSDFVKGFEQGESDVNKFISVSTIFSNTRHID